MEVYEKVFFINSELYCVMNLYVGNLCLFSGLFDQVWVVLFILVFILEDKVVLQNLKCILVKVQEMWDQCVFLEQQLCEFIQKDDIIVLLVIIDYLEMKKLFEEQLKKYDQLKVYLEQNLVVQDCVFCVLIEVNVQYVVVWWVFSDLD